MSASSPVTVTIGSTEPVADTWRYSIRYPSADASMSGEASMSARRRARSGLGTYGRMTVITRAPATRSASAASATRGRTISTINDTMNPAAAPSTRAAASSANGGADTFASSRARSTRCSKARFRRRASASNWCVESNATRA